MDDCVVCDGLGCEFCGKAQPEYETPREITWLWLFTICFAFWYLVSLVIVRVIQWA